MKKTELKKMVIKQNQTVHQAMKAIDDNYREIVFIENDNFQIIGTVTDGDIRRGLLAGLTVDSRVEMVMKREFIYVGPNVDRAAVLDLMKARVIRQVPVLDEAMRLLGVHFLEDLIGAAVKPNIAVIMAGGKGVRLRPLTENCPKPMMNVAGRPILERLVLQLVGYGIRKIFIAINYLGGMIEEYFGDGSGFGCSIEYLREEKPLGTGGPLSLLSDIPDHPFLVMNGDLVTQVNIAKLLEFHEKSKFETTITARTYQTEMPFGVIKKEGDRLVKLEEKPFSSYLINTGIYVFNPSILSYLPKNEEFPITSLFDILLEKDIPVAVYILEEEWIDIGRHEELKRANGEI